MRVSEEVLIRISKDTITQTVDYLVDNKFICLCSGESPDKVKVRLKALCADHILR